MPTAHAMNWPIELTRHHVMQVVENNYELLLVSQFTLFGKLKGNKLEFVKVSSALQSVEVRCMCPRDVVRMYQTTIE